MAASLPAGAAACADRANTAKAKPKTEFEKLLRANEEKAAAARLAPSFPLVATPEGDRGPNIVLGDAAVANHSITTMHFDAAGAGAAIAGLARFKVTENGQERAATEMEVRLFEAEHAHVRCGWHGNLRWVEGDVTTFGAAKIEALTDSDGWCSHGLKMAHGVGGKLTDAVASDVPTGMAFERIKQALKEDEGYAWSWHCNIAMANYDADKYGGMFAHENANRAAALAMKRLFDVDVTTYPSWKSLEGDWLALREAMKPRERDPHVKPAIAGLGAVAPI